MVGGLLAADGGGGVEGEEGVVGAVGAMGSLRRREDEEAAAAGQRGWCAVEMLPRWAFVLGIIGVGIAAAVDPVGAAHSLRSVLRWVESLGSVGGPLLFVGLYAVAVVILVPSSWMTLAAAYVFVRLSDDLVEGIAIAFAVSYGGAMLGAAGCFFGGRWLFRRSLVAAMAHWPLVRALDRAIRKHTLKVIVLVRLSPLFPFGVSNYILGATHCLFPQFALGTIVGTIPGTLAYTIAGGTLTSVQQIVEGAASIDPTINIIVLSVGIAATLLLLAVITLYARRELLKVMREEEEREAGGEEEERDAGGEEEERGSGVEGDDAQQGQNPQTTSSSSSSTTSSSSSSNPSHSPSPSSHSPTPPSSSSPKIQPRKEGGVAEIV